MGGDWRLHTGPNPQGRQEGRTGAHVPIQLGGDDNHPFRCHARLLPFCSECRGILQVRRQLSKDCRGIIFRFNPFPPTA